MFRDGFIAGLAVAVVPMTAPPVAVRDPLVVSDNALRLTEEALTASHWLSAADQTTKIVSPADRVSVLKGTPLVPIIWPLPALETTIGFVMFIALI